MSQSVAVAEFVNRFRERPFVKQALVSWQTVELLPQTRERKDRHPFAGFSKDEI